MNAPAPLPPLQGGCLGGQARYRARPDHRDGYDWHCRMCQLAFGNTRAAYLNLRKSEVEWLGAPAHCASSKIARRGFCGHCGTPLSFGFLDSQRMDLSIGSLDEPWLIKPGEHFALESRLAAWHAPDGLPETRRDAHPQIVQRWREAYGHSVVPGLAAARGEP